MFLHTEHLFLMKVLLLSVFCLRGIFCKSKNAHHKGSVWLICLKSDNWLAIYWCLPIFPLINQMVIQNDSFSCSTAASRLFLGLYPAGNFLCSENVSDLPSLNGAFSSHLKMRRMFFSLKIKQTLQSFWSFCTFKLSLYLENHPLRLI